MSLLHILSEPEWTIPLSGWSQKSVATVKNLASQSKQIKEAMINKFYPQMHPNKGLHKRQIWTGVVQRKGPYQCTVVCTKPDKSIRSLEASDKARHLSLFLFNFRISPTWFAASWLNGQKASYMSCCSEQNCCVSLDQTRYSPNLFSTNDLA